MSDKFRLFISNSAKTKDEIDKEIRRVIREKIASVVETAAEETAEYLKHKLSEGEKIPPKSNMYYPTGGEKSPRNYTTGYQPDQPQDDIYQDEIAYPPERPDEDAPITEKIRQMRQRGMKIRTHTITMQEAADSLVVQGEFMKDETDDYPRTAFCCIERPIYACMSFSQLRTYFTWRTDVRRGVYNRTDPPYIMLYCYELLNKIGVQSSTDALNRLIDVWTNCRQYYPRLDEYMPAWIKDFYAFNNINLTVKQVMELFPVKPPDHDSDISRIFAGDYSNLLNYLAAHSVYDIKSSAFCTQENLPLLNGAIEAALKAAARHFGSYGTEMPEIICGKMKTTFSWKPFENAYADLKRMDGFHSVKICNTNRYSLKHGEPVMEQLVFAPHRYFIGYLLKSAEAVVRKRTGYRYSVVPKPYTVRDDFINRTCLLRAVDDPGFAKLIPNAVNAWCDDEGIFPPKAEKKKKTEPLKVEIDVTKLAQIRKESDEITRRLIVDDLEDEIPTEQAEKVAAVKAQTFGEQTSTAAAEMTENAAPPEKEAAPAAAKDYSHLPYEWQSFGAEMNKLTAETLEHLLDGTAEEYCRSKNLLPEAAYESINELALEEIGDILIDNGEIIEDYRETVEQLVHCN